MATNYCVAVRMDWQGLPGHWEYLRPHPNAQRLVFSSGDLAMAMVEDARRQFADVRIEPIDRAANVCDEALAPEKKGKKGGGK